MAGKIRVYELAKELKKSNREVQDRLRKLGIDAPTNFSSITPEEANRVRVSFGLSPLKIEKEKAAKPKAKKAAKPKTAKKPEKKAAKPEKPAKKAKKPSAKPAKKPAKVLKPAKKAAKPAKKAAKLAKKETKVKAKPEERKLEKQKLEPLPAEDIKKAEEPTRAPVFEKPVTEEETIPTAETKPVIELAPKPPVTKKEQIHMAAGKPEPAQRDIGQIEIPKRLEDEEVEKIIPPRKKKPTLRIAPVEKIEKAAPEKKVYKFVPRAKGVPRGEIAKPSTVAPKLIRVPSGITVKEFAMKTGLTPAEVIKKMLTLGEMVTINQPLSDEALMLLAAEIGIEIKIKTPKFTELTEIVDKPSELKPRPPVVTIMGHVDHGKTLLLDTIRKTDVISSEFGGITQHIGAYQVVHEGKPITFIDTPGHESFTAMRARGAEITDIAVLVVACDDGVMPQTIEALNHAKAAGVPIIVAVNKIDKPEGDPYKVRQQLSEHGLVPEEWGGETIYVDISAKEGTNIDHLLEMILIIAELQELKANPQGEAAGVVIEARLDKSKGPVATILVQRGTARVGDVIVVGSAWGKIRAMFNDRGEQVESAGPAVPVEILGLSGLPMAGDEFRVVSEEKKAKQIADRRKILKKLEEQAGTPRHISLDTLFERIKEGEVNQLKVVLKADTQGSLEAVRDTLDKLPQQEVRLNVIHSGVGGITETDVMLASASDAIILGFNTRPDSKAQKAAEREEVEIRTYQVIYKLSEDMEAALKGMLAPEYVEKVTGRAEIRQVFKIPNYGMVAGSYVLEGEITRGSKVRIVRDGVVVYDGILSSLKRFKDDVKSVSAGFECGIGISDFRDIKAGDVVEGYLVEEIPRQ